MTFKQEFHRLSFDGPGGVLAHASFPTVGEIHFDDDDNWLINGGRKDGYDLMWVRNFLIKSWYICYLLRDPVAVKTRVI